MTVVPFPPRQSPYFANADAVIDFARSMQNVGILTEHHRLELIALIMNNGEIDNAEALEALANLMGQTDQNADRF